MSKTFYQDELIIFTVTFYSDPEKTIPIDPVDVTLELQNSDGLTIEANVNPDGSRPANTGKYIATFDAEDYGTLDWRWITDTPRIVRQGTIFVNRKSTA